MTSRDDQILQTLSDYELIHVVHQPVLSNQTSEEIKIEEYPLSYGPTLSHSEVDDTSLIYRYERRIKWTTIVLGLFNSLSFVFQLTMAVIDFWLVYIWLVSGSYYSDSQYRDSFIIGICHLVVSTLFSSVILIGILSLFNIFRTRTQLKMAIIYVVGVSLLIIGQTILNVLFAIIGVEITRMFYAISIIGTVVLGSLGVLLTCYRTYYLYNRGI